MTESATDLEYRDDFQFVNASVLNATVVCNLHPVRTRHLATMTSRLSGAVNAAGNTAFSDLSNQQTILNDLTTATDHLPVVADYTIIAATPEPSAFVSDGFCCHALALGV